MLLFVCSSHPSPLYQRSSSEAEVSHFHRRNNEIDNVSGLLSSGLLTFFLRRQKMAFLLTLLAALSFAGMLALFAFGNNPINVQVASWTPQTIPANWRSVRDAWDSFHAASSALAALALILLLLATLRD